MSVFNEVKKRAIDILLSILCLTLLSPIIVIVVILIKLTSKGPILFKQKRIGKNKTIFTIYKFRTMSIDAPKDTPTHLIQYPNNYITTIGTFLRQTSIDELPQIINILKGDMAIVGPRPALWNQSDLIIERDIYDINSIQVGLTGWAQINGRDNLSISEKVKLESWHINNNNIWSDIKCILITLPVVFLKKGVREGGPSNL